MNIESILHTTDLTKEELENLLSTTGYGEQALFNHAAKIKKKYIDNIVYLRGLIEFSNICKKNCYYCGIRHKNSHTHRYCLTHDEVMQAVKFSYKNGLGSIAIQSGEVSSKRFTNQINAILKEAKRITNNEIGITLSCGEQSEDTYRQWFESGADRYLLRIESASEELYYKIHPKNARHSFTKRLHALEMLKKIGYQTGTGVMIGLPFQTTKHLVNDLLFMKEFDIDMCGMGPYIEHIDTPLYQHKAQLLPLAKRLNLSFKMVALLRILMPDINIAATTAMQTIEKNGREKAICIGANVLMPNITPKKYRDNYFLYKNKPISAHNNQDELQFLEQQLKTFKHEIGYFQQGNSKRYEQR